MKINLKINTKLLLIIFVSYLIKDHDTSKTKTKTKSKTNTKSKTSTNSKTSTKTNTKTSVKSHLFPSTTQNCGALCMECSVNDSQSCISCLSGIYDYNNKCYIECPDNTYSDDEWQICQPCDSSCPVCWGPTSEMCGLKKGLKVTTVILENEIKNYFYQIKNYNKKRLIDNHQENHNEIEGYILPKIHRKKVNRKYENYNNNNKINDDNEINKLEFDSNNYILIDNYNWLNNLNLILKNINPFDIFPRNHRTRIDFTKEEDIDSTISINDVYGSKKIHSELPIGSFSRKDGIFIPIPSYLDENMDIIESHWIFVKGNWIGDKWVNNWVPKLPTFIKTFGKKDKMYYENGGYWLYDNRKGKFILQINNKILH
jgi:hypothetical protein